MGPTVREQMDDDTRREQLIRGLSNTQNEEVTIDVSHMIQAIGLKEADRLTEALTDSVMAIGSPRPKSAQRAKFQRAGLAKVNRVAVLNACLAARAEAAKKKIDKKLGPAQPSTPS